MLNLKITIPFYQKNIPKKLISNHNMQPNTLKRRKYKGKIYVKIILDPEPIYPKQVSDPKPIEKNGSTTLAGGKGIWDLPGKRSWPQGRQRCP